MGPHATNLSVQQATAAAQDDDRLLAAAREAFPHWRIIETAGGYAAVHAEAVYLDAASLDGLVGQLRQQ
jgi:hypothetical protein